MEIQATNTEGKLDSASLSKMEHKMGKLHRRLTKGSVSNSSLEKFPHRSSSENTASRRYHITTVPPPSFITTLTPPDSHNITTLQLKSNRSSHQRVSLRSRVFHRESSTLLTEERRKPEHHSNQNAAAPVRLATAPMESLQKL